MEKVVIDAATRAKLGPLVGHVTLADEAGKTVGIVLPPKQYAELMLAWASREPTREELEAAREEYRTRGGKTTAEVLAHLEQVRLDWEAGRG